DRRQIMRVENAQHCFGDFREVVVELLANPGVHESTRFHQPAHQGIVHAVRAQTDPPSDLRVLLGELCSELADEGEFSLIVIKQRVAHGRSSRNSKRPVEESRAAWSETGDPVPASAASILSRNRSDGPGSASSTTRTSTSRGSNRWIADSTSFRRLSR